MVGPEVAPEMEPEAVYGCNFAGTTGAGTVYRSRASQLQQNLLKKTNSVFSKVCDLETGEK